MNDMVTDQWTRCWDWTLILKNECSLMRHWGFEIFALWIHYLKVTIYDLLFSYKLIPP